MAFIVHLVAEDFQNELSHVKEMTENSISRRYVY